MLVLILELDDGRVIKPCIITSANTPRQDVFEDEDVTYVGF